MIRNIDRMYYGFGYAGNGKYCHECQHFRKECWNKKAQKKVIGYDENGNAEIDGVTRIVRDALNKLDLTEHDPAVDGSLEEWTAGEESKFE